MYGKKKKDICASKYEDRGNQNHKKEFAIKHDNQT